MPKTGLEGFVLVVQQGCCGGNLALPLELVECPLGTGVICLLMKVANSVPD